ncbi:hypothetical protein SCAR479_07280 [Seiridium cardinale]|uniref:NACHT domain-containing protein n=1 Tax=Seiridium cardinale TaxID=138064 RepID=A0ABR2XQT3_9PEZI
MNEISERSEAVGLTTPRGNRSKDYSNINIPQGQQTPTGAIDGPSGAVGVGSAHQSIVTRELRNEGGVNFKSEGHVEGTTVHFQSINANQGDVNVDQITYMNETHMYGTDEHLKPILKWLVGISDLHFHQKQEQYFRIAQIAPTTDNSYLAWRDGDIRQLWCYGHPGVGKTILASVIIDDLKNEIRKKDSIDLHRRGCIYVYFNYQERDRQIPAMLLANILTQLIQIQGRFSNETRDAFKAYRGREESPSQEEYLRLIKAELTAFREVFLVMDALDECPSEIVDNERYQFLEAICELSLKVKATFTSRPQRSFYEPLEPEAEISITTRHDDLENLVNIRLDESKSLKAFVDGKLKTDPYYRTTLVHNILGTAQETYLLTNLRMEVVARRMMSVSERDAVSLSSLPESYTQFYSATMDRISGKTNQDKELAMSILSWVCFAARPLNMDQLEFILNSRLESVLLNRDTISSVCEHLVSVNEANLVHFMHYTAREYLSRHIASSETQALITEQCIQSFDRNPYRDMELSSAPEARIQCAEFKKYAADYWGFHLRRIEPGRSSKTRTKALSFVLSPQSVAESVRCMTDPTMKSLLDINGATFDQIGPLHLVAYFGSGSLASSLIRDYGIGIDRVTPLGHTALHWAVVFRRKRIIEILLKYQANPNIQDSKGRTILHWAIANQDRDSVRTILKSSDSVNFNLEDKLTHTPLRLAAANGALWAVEMLFPYADINDESKDGFSPLRLAAQNRHMDVVKFLCRRGAAVTDSANTGWSLWFTSAGHGDHELIKFLIDQGTDVNQTNTDGLTALQLAIRYKHEEVAWYLISAGADKDVRDASGRTILHEFVYSWKSQKDKAFLWVLLENRVPVDVQDTSGMTVLQETARDGNGSAAWLLIERGADFDIQNSQGLTALHLALDHERLSIAWLLIEKGANCNIRDKKGRTVLHIAALHGLVPLVSHLLYKGVDVNILDEGQRSPLHLAAAHMQTAIIELLAMATDCELRDGNGRTALHCAIVDSDEQAARCLIQNCKNVNLADDEGQSALHIASHAGRVNMVNLLLKSGASADQQDSEGRTALHLAIQGEHIDLACLLIEQKADVNLADKNRESALHFAARLGNSKGTKDLIECLLSMNANAGLRNSNSKTARQIGLESNQDIGYWQ